MVLSEKCASRGKPRWPDKEVPNSARPHHLRTPKFKSQHFRVARNFYPLPRNNLQNFRATTKKLTEHPTPTENQTTARPQRSAGQASTSRQSNSQHPIPLSLPAPEMALRPPPTASDHRATISAA